MNFSAVKAITIPEGSVKQITDSQGRILWKKKSLIPEFFYIENITDNIGNVTIVKVGTVEENQVWFSEDQTYWVRMGDGESVLIEPHSRLYLRGSTGVWSNSTRDYRTIKCSVKFNAGGVLNSLINDVWNRTTPPERAFTHLFGFDNSYRPITYSNIVDASALILSNYTSHSCYSYMFQDCRSLTTPPKLTATVWNGCPYSSMFQGCTKLVKVPKLYATDVYYNWLTGKFEGMFQNCTSLKVYSQPGPGHDRPWRLPENGVYTSETIEQSQLFAGVQTDNVPAHFVTEQGHSYTLYTEYDPL